MDIENLKQLRLRLVAARCSLGIRQHEREQANKERQGPFVQPGSKLDELYADCDRYAGLAMKLEREIIDAVVGNAEGN